MSNVTYTVTVRRVVTEDIDIQITVPAGDVDGAIDAARRQAQQGVSDEAIVETWAVGNIHGSDGSLWA